MVLAAFDADGTHLFELQQADVHYQLPIFDSGFGQTKDLTQCWVGDCNVKDEYTLVYDFGDMWQFKIRFEGIEPKRVPSHTNPEMLEGSGNGILDDIGGAHGLTQAAKDDPAINKNLDVAAFQQEWLRKIGKIRNSYE